MKVTIEVSEAVIKELIANAYDVTVHDVTIERRKESTILGNTFKYITAVVTKDIQDELIINKEINE